MKYTISLPVGNGSPCFRLEVVGLPWIFCDGDTESLRSGGNQGGEKALSRGVNWRGLSKGQVAKMWTPLGSQQG